MADTFGSYATRLRRFEHELRSNPAMGHALGKMAKEEATKAASADLGGDPKFSGWAPILTTKYRLLKDTPGIMLMPGSRKAAGPWTVADHGRNRGNAGGFSGPGINRKTGLTSFTKTGRVRRPRAFKGKRWNGVTYGFGTAGKAHAKMEKNMRKVVDRAISRAIRKVF